MGRREAELRKNEWIKKKTRNPTLGLRLRFTRFAAFRSRNISTLDIN